MTAALNAWSALRGATQREFATGDPGALELYAYCERFSYVAGEVVRLFVHSTFPRVNVEVTCDSRRGEIVFERLHVPAKVQPTDAEAYATGCRWSDPVSIPVAREWPSGV